MDSELEDLCSYVNEKIGNIKKILSIRNLGKRNRLRFGARTLP
ncbi:RIKEN cDNA 2810433K01, isoform CRA_b [Mus musculus]|nr:RIKEN cDNA 2810433K01, isoform CRA_b [Mus musculus]